MKKIKNLKVKATLLLCFGFILVLTCVLGAVGASGVLRLTNVADYYAEDVVPGVEDLWTVRRGARIFESLALESLVVTSESELDKIEQELAETREEVDIALEEYVSIRTEDKEIVDEIIADLDDITYIRTKIFEKSRLFTEEGDAEAYKIFLNEYEPKFEEIVENATLLAERVEKQLDEQQNEIAIVKLSSLLIIAAVVIFVLVCVVLIVKSLTSLIVTPLKQIEDAAKALRNGDFENVKLDWDSEDEFGQTIKAFQGTFAKMKIIIHDVARLTKEMGNGNFNINTDCLDEYTGAYNDIIVGLRYIRDTLSETILNIEDASSQVKVGAGQMSDGAQALSQGAVEQASSVQELQATISELFERVKENTVYANEASEESNNAEKGVEECNNQMRDLMAAMGVINETSNEISKIIKNIEDIAFQTNILALNAAVEAARAGEAGKGFAVVADEVRNLAGKSAEAAKSTTDLVGNTIDAIGKGNGLAKNTESALNDVVGKVENVNEKIIAIAKASEIQQEAVAQLNTGIEQISAVVQMTSATAEESAAASEELSAQADLLQEMIKKFNLK